MRGHLIRALQSTCFAEQPDLIASSSHRRSRLTCFEETEGAGKGAEEGAGKEGAEGSPDEKPTDKGDANQGLPEEKENEDGEKMQGGSQGEGEDQNTNAFPQQAGNYNPSEAAPPEDPAVLKEKGERTLNNLKQELVKVTKTAGELAGASEELGKRNIDFAALSELINRAKTSGQTVQQLNEGILKQIKKMQFEQVQEAEEASFAAFPQLLLPFVSAPPAGFASRRTSDRARAFL